MVATTPVVTGVGDGPLAPSLLPEVEAAARARDAIRERVVHPRAEYERELDELRADLTTVLLCRDHVEAVYAVMPVGHPDRAFMVGAQREMVETARQAEVWLRPSALGPLAPLRQRGRWPASS